MAAEEQVHTVVVLPADFTFTAHEGESIFDAARRNGIDWPTRCIGHASCRLCYVEVATDCAALSEMARLEKDALKRVLLNPVPGLRVRLACQARVLADVEVHRMGVRKP